MWNEEAKVGPLLVLPGQRKSGPVSEADLPPLLSKISRPTLYGSQWRGGTSDKKDGERKITTQEQGLLYSRGPQ